MNNANSPYNQQESKVNAGQMPSQGARMPQSVVQPARQPMPTPPMPPVQSMAAKARRIRKLEDDLFPKWLTQYPIAAYILALMVVTFLYSSYSLPWYYMLSGIVAVTVFFLYGSHVVERTSVMRIHRAKNFEKRIFFIAFVPRLLFMFLLYWIFMSNYGDAFGFENQDAIYYDELGQEVANLISKGNFHFHDEIVKLGAKDDIADMGYGVYVGFIYWMTDNNIIAVRLLKCFWSAITVLLIYRLAKRNFSEQTARVAAIFCALWPNFWYYCGVHLKEIEMVFLAVLFVEQADQMLRSRQFTAWKVIPVLLIGASLLTFRTALALVAFLSLVFSVVMSSSRVVSFWKRIIVGGLVIALIGVVAGNRIQEEARGLMDTVQEGQQQSNMEWRSKRDNGNEFAKYAGKSVFAPLIFTIPFPTMVRPFEGQDVQQLLNGGNFIKNIISFFTIFAMFLLLLSGCWRDHLLPLSFMLGYLVVLTMSTFAQSERFHQPIMPYEFMFAAYGLSVAITKLKYKRWFIYWCILMFIAAIAWNWFKLAGRGLV